MTIKKHSTIWYRLIAMKLGATAVSLQRLRKTSCKDTKQLEGIVMMLNVEIYYDNQKLEV